MPRDDVELELSSLAELRDALSHQTYALALLAAFDAESLTDARPSAGSRRLGYAGQPAGCCGTARPRGGLVKSAWIEVRWSAVGP